MWAPCAVDIISAMPIERWIPDPVGPNEPVSDQPPVVAAPSDVPEVSGPDESEASPSDSVESPPAPSEVPDDPRLDESLESPAPPSAVIDGSPLSKPTESAPWWSGIADVTHQPDSMEPPTGAHGDAGVETALVAPPAPGASLEVAEPFRLFHAHFGPSLCGAPVSRITMVDGRPVQYFENLALVELEGGRVAPLPIGEAAFLAGAPESTGRELSGAAGPHTVEDLTGKLPRHPLLRYPERPLAQIRHIVLHHTATSADVGPYEVAAEHVEVNRWPGIGYHFFVSAEGRASRTQDLNAQTFHARQFNPAAVGIALAGDYTSAVPPAPQLDAVADLIADLVRDLGLPLSSIRGHREIVGTPCPGETFLTLWKPRLVRLVEARLAAATTRAEAAV